MPEESSGYSFGNRVKLLRVTPEPKQIPIGIAARKGRLSPAAVLSSVMNRDSHR